MIHFALTENLHKQVIEVWLGYQLVATMYPTEIGIHIIPNDGTVLNVDGTVSVEFQTAGAET